MTVTFGTQIFSDWDYYKYFSQDLLSPNFHPVISPNPDWLLFRKHHHRGKGDDPKWHRLTHICLDHILFGYLLFRWVCCLVSLVQTHGDLQFIRVASCLLFLNLCLLGTWKSFPLVATKILLLSQKNVDKQTHSFHHHSKMQMQPVIVGTSLAGRENRGDGKFPPQPHIFLLLLPHLVPFLHVHVIPLAHSTMCDFPKAY